MAAVRAEYKVLRAEVQALPHNRRFLADREMRRAAMLALDALPGALALDVLQHGLELANEQHVAIDAQQAGRRHGGPRPPAGRRPRRWPAAPAP